MVGKNIKRFREKASMTQQELGGKLCVTRQAVSSWENGKTEPDLETLGKIAEVLEVSAEELIYGETKTQPVVRTVTKEGGKSGLGFGAALAMVISYAKWHSIKWAILHGLLGWFYVIYYVAKYK